MYKLKYKGVTLPEIYVVERREASKARELGVPFMIKPRGWDDDRLIKVVLYHWLLEHYPYINWSTIIGHPRTDFIHVEVPSDWRENPGEWTDGYTSEGGEFTEDGEYRMTAGGMDSDDVDITEFTEVSFDDFFEPSKISVNIDVLQKLKLLPKFMDDIATAIRTNLYNTAWMDGWNKKLDAPLGSYYGSNEAPNLIILDTSGSIPRGIASTMISLIDTLREQANADLIITSGTSRYYKKGEPLPTPEQLSYLVGGMNECKQFYTILDQYILGKHWGNVICFGDQDAPDDRRFKDNQGLKPTSAKFTSTRIDNLMSFHTYKEKTPGYARWVKFCQPKVSETIDTTWVSNMDKRYR